MNGANYAIDEHGMGQIEDQIRMICGLNWIEWQHSFTAKDLSTNKIQ